MPPWIWNATFRCRRYNHDVVLKKRAPGTQYKDMYLVLSALGELTVQSRN